MPLTLDAAKFTPPQLHQVLRRERLNRRIADGDRRRHAIVVGQAAQGKSTLLADALRHDPTAVGWIHLDAADSNPAALYSLLVRAASRADPSVAVSDLADLPDMAFGAGDPMERYRTGLGALRRRMDSPITLVLDGLDRIDPASPAMALVAEQVDSPLSGLRWVIATRELPAFHFQRRVLTQSVLVLDNQELAFTADELTAYFRLRHDLDLAPETARRLARVTGGWTGAVVLISQALDRTDRSQWETVLDRDLPDPFSDDAWQFFSEEVFGRQPTDVQAFLMESAVFDILDPALLDSTLHHGGAAGILADLARRHVFAERMDVADKPIYRYNRLFREFLLVKLEKAMAAPELRDFYRRVGDAYSRGRLAEVAIGYYGKSGDLDRVAAGLKKIGMDFLARGQFADLGGHFALLADDTIRQDPWLLLYLTVTRRITGGVRNLVDYESALEGFTAANDLRGRLLALAYLIEAHVFLGSDADATLLLIHRAEAVLAELGAEPRYTYAKTLLWLQIGFGHIAVGTDVTKGLSAGRNAQLIATKMGDGQLVGTAAVVQAMGLTATGEFDRADAVLTQAGTQIDVGAFPEYGVLQAIVGLNLSLGRGQLNAAQSAIDTISPSIDDFGLLFFYPAVVDATGFLQIYQGRFEAAAASARHLMDVAAMSGNPLYSGLANRLSALIFYHQDRCREALAPAEAAVAALTATGHSTRHGMQAQLLLALVRFHVDSSAVSEVDLDGVRNYCRDTGDRLGLVESAIALGLMAAAHGRMAACDRHLGDGFTQAAAGGYTQMPMLSPGDVIRACRRVDGRMTGAGQEWVAAWLAGHPGDVPAAPPVSAVAVKTDPFRSAVPPLIIRTFGGFVVHPEGAPPIPKQAWAGNRTQLLLKAIVVHGLREIPKDILIDALWPESRGRSAAQNFKTTLHRLRKAIQPDLVRGQRSAYLQLKSGRISLNRELCRVDAAEFLQDCKDIKRILSAGETLRLVALADRVRHTYRGDFLPEEPYAPWAEMKRWALREEFVTVMTRVADVLSARQGWKESIDCCRAVLRADPCQEAAARHLMVAYAAIGRSGDAVAVHQTLRTALRDELGMAPDPATEAVRKKIMAANG